MQMTENRFREIVDAYGADENRWPKGEQQSARAFKGENPSLAAQICEGHLQLDSVLDSAAKPATDDTHLDGADIKTGASTAASKARPPMIARRAPRRHMSSAALEIIGGYAYFKHGYGVWHWPSSG